MSRKRVLVVEDEAKLRELLKASLEPEYEVVLAQDGEEGLTMARAKRPDAILLDLWLPRLDGMNVLRLLRTSEDTIAIPVVIVTANGGSSSILEAGSLGAVDYLIKPFQLSDVRQMVQRYVGSSRPESWEGGRDEA